MGEERADQKVGSRESAHDDEGKRLALETQRLRAMLLRREALLRAAARKLRRYNPGDPVAASIDTELGD